MKDYSYAFNINKYYIRKPVIPFMTKMKTRIRKWLLNNPPYGHPKLTPEKAIKYAD